MLSFPQLLGNSFRNGNPKSKWLNQDLLGNPGKLSGWKLHTVNDEISTWGAYLKF